MRGFTAAGRKTAFSGVRMAAAIVVLAVAFIVMASFADRAEGAEGDKFGDAVSITAGSEHSCAVIESGRAVCWGAGGDGRLGNGTTGSRDRPGFVKGLADAATVTAGGSHTCATRTSGRILCWGNNEVGQLGDNSTDPRLTSTPVFGTVTATAVTAGRGHSCAVDVGRAALCWGTNGLGQVGDGTGTDRLVPTYVLPLSGVRSISAGTAHTCAVKTSGNVLCWGFNFDGRLGTGISDPDRHLAPVSVSGLTDADSVTAGNEHTCALRGDGRVACWGRNDQGHLGDGSRLYRTTPVHVTGLDDARMLTSGDAHTCAIRESGQAVCWGSNTFGQLGNETVATGQGAYSTAPIEVAGLDDAREIAAGGDHTCAIRESGEAVCWGSNSSGQLGDGTTGGNRHLPVEVLAAPDLVGLTVTTDGDGAGTVRAEAVNILCGEACSAELEEGTEVELTAEAAPGSKFAGWRGACAGTGTCRVTMDRAVTVTAGFDREPPVGPPPPEPDPVEARLGPLKPVAKPKTVRRGRATTVTVRVRNSGNGPSPGVRVCGNGPKRLVRIVKRCLRIAAIQAGKTVAVRFKVKNISKPRRSRKAVLAFTATGEGLRRQSARVTLRLK